MYQTHHIASGKLAVLLSPVETVSIKPLGTESRNSESETFIILLKSTKFTIKLNYTLNATIINIHHSILSLLPENTKAIRTEYLLRPGNYHKQRKIED